MADFFFIPELKTLVVINLTAMYVRPMMCSILERNPELFLNQLLSESQQNPSVKPRKCAKGAVHLGTWLGATWQ